jgi:hypothetical protein
MDRALVHTTQTFEEPSGELRCVRNLPFELVPRELIEQIRPYADPPSYEQWLAWCPYFNRMPNYWNLALIDRDNQIVAFQYGTWDPCGAEMHIIRGTVHPKMFRASGEVLKRAMNDVREFARELGMRRVYWITCRWKAFQRKLPDDVALMEAKVMEVLNV